MRTSKIPTLLAAFKYATQFTTYSRHTVTLHPHDYVFYNWKFASFDSFHPFTHPHPASTNRQSILRIYGLGLTHSFLNNIISSPKAETTFYSD